MCIWLIRRRVWISFSLSFSLSLMSFNKNWWDFKCLSLFPVRMCWANNNFTRMHIYEPCNYFGDIIMIGYLENVCILIWLLSIIYVKDGKSKEETNIYAYEWIWFFTFLWSLFADSISINHIYLCRCSEYLPFIFLVKLDKRTLDLLYIQMRFYHIQLLWTMYLM